jgi:hypothetical protein
MSNLAVFIVVTAVAVLMLIVSIRALTWHTISRFLQTILLLLVIVATWLVITRDGLLSFEEGLLLALSALLGLVIGFIRGQAALLRFDLAVGDVVCRRGSLLIFCWAAVAVTNITLLVGSRPRVSIWQVVLPAALTFLTTAFLASTLTILSRITAMQRETQAQAGRETQ